MKLLFDVNRNRWYNENGDLFSGYRPSIPYGNTERVEIQLYSEITNANSGSAAVADWTKYTDLDGENYGAVLSVDNNFLHWFKTTLQGDLAEGSVATVSVATNESIDNIAESGDIYIYADSNATPEALEYTSRVKISSGIQFTLATGATLQNAYSSGSQVDIPEMLYAEALMIDEESDPATGLFVFDLVMDSPKLRNAMQYKSVERLADVKGLELMIYQTGDNNTLKILKRFRCGSFSIEGGIADLKTGVPVPDTRQSEILALINRLLHQSGAIVKNQPISTTVGGYTIEHTSGGIAVYGSGASVTLSGGSAAIAYENEETGDAGFVRIGAGGVAAQFIGAGIADVIIDQGGDVVVSADTGSATVSAAGGVFANGSAITQATSEFDGTSLGIGALTGGVKYVCASALTALSVGSAAPGCNGTIFFTLASGGVVTPPSNVTYFGVTSYTAGSSYVMAINGDMAVCVEAAVVPGV